MLCSGLFCSTNCSSFRLVFCEIHDIQIYHLLCPYFALLTEIKTSFSLWLAKILCSLLCSQITTNPHICDFPVWQPQLKQQQSWKALPDWKHNSFMPSRMEWLVSLGSLRLQELKTSHTWRLRLEVLLLILKTFHSLSPELLPELFFHPQSQVFQSYSVFRTTTGTHEDRDADISVRMNADNTATCREYKITKFSHSEEQS